MSAHSIVEAKNHLSELVDRAMKGEQVVITRHGQPVVELKAMSQQTGRPMTKTDMDWLWSVMVRPEPPDNDPRSIVERMRDDDNERLFRR
ncbi:MAG TPA: type II toxin-antitoxin system prevent-host-death family antitoxin [Caulobacteraceae bacterium]|jgi:antitoxin (DNA-binding transcriptional repressor) of toxin-antitoxin stability system|nr:type II toxin-antitoxin system prevent-host-death family antitoxin [Caulobacteraceae bacterium]